MATLNEHITHEASNPWICICHNQPDYYGFYPCEREGNEVEPVEGWQGLYVCGDCGRIIKASSLEIVGLRGSTNS